MCHLRIIIEFSELQNNKESEQLQMLHLRIILEFSELQNNKPISTGTDAPFGDHYRVQ